MSSIVSTSAVNYLYSCAWCENECTEEISILRKSDVWCEAIRSNTTILPFCCYECHDNLAREHLNKDYDEVRLEARPEQSLPKRRKCAECADRCSDAISLTRWGALDFQSSLAFCGTSCYVDFAERQMKKDFIKGTM